ncbi:lipopolysaccharide transport periplasmic protein LptA [Sulfuricurvum sp.]|uniref:lipopolysaccharide transport periplasmic protein LptA n=1 Tax=Sulfuricurvum sp. TaxID=2025608 RepID=UPI0019879578|nr:lipopolysaccharide transport periplasmic protein LptA [Sulfuricurvum sp.]MBD3798623.1 lipopolysaccharide transport periplasmic protein LptA [Campylobacterota bacterium]MBD3805720.1 lipopolysaccharide transport periplasmic protein LptA [Sulfuricurvum sp.]
MLRFLAIIAPLFSTLLLAEELKVISDTFKGDQRNGISVFNGNVKVTKGYDELNASKVTIYTDKENKPTKYLAEGDVTFYIVTEVGEKYKGKAQSAVYLPNESEYQFSKKVDLIRIDDYRRIKGDRIVVNTTQGHALAESANDEPVIMTFTIHDKKSKSAPK